MEWQHGNFHRLQRFFAGELAVVLVVDLKLSWSFDDASCP
jgi:hypothetical protein